MLVKIESETGEDNLFGEFSREQITPCNHTSVGALVFNETTSATPKLLLIRGRIPPYGLAPPAWHVDGSATYPGTARLRLRQEVGLEPEDLVELVRIRMKDKCRRINGDWHTWRIYRAHVTGSIQTSRREIESADWYSRDALECLAARTDLFRTAQISETEWNHNPGLEEVWHDLFRQIGMLEDIKEPQRRKVPSFLYGRVPIIGRYYGAEYGATQRAAHALQNIGMQTYPKRDAESVALTSADGDTFAFLGGPRLVVPPYEAQLGFFRQIQRAHDLPEL